MAKTILVMGESGSGKSRSIKNLPPEETFLIKVTDKDLPFKGGESNYTKYDPKTQEGNCLITHKINHIIKAYSVAADKGFKYIVVDDFQYLMSFEFMERVKEKGYEKFNDIAKIAFDAFMEAKKAEVEYVIFLAHSEEIYADGIKKVKMKTVGKLVDDKITPEGLFTVGLLTGVDTVDGNREYYFATQSDGSNTIKSPEGMFDLKIPNDLMYVINKIKEYNQ